MNIPASSYPVQLEPLDAEFRVLPARGLLGNRGPSRDQRGPHTDRDTTTGRAGCPARHGIEGNAIRAGRNAGCTPECFAAAPRSSRGRRASKLAPSRARSRLRSVPHRHKAQLDRRPGLRRAASLRHRRCSLTRRERHLRWQAQPVRCHNRGNPGLAGPAPQRDRGRSLRQLAAMPIARH